jgi:hypothetical protein
MCQHCREKALEGLNQNSSDTEDEETNQIIHEEQYNKLVNLDDEELKSIEPFLSFLRKKNIEVSQECNRLNLQLEVIHCYKELLETRIRQTELKKENEGYQILNAAPSKMYGEISNALHKKTPFELTVEELKFKFLI